jgi:hypothetical protein
MTIGYNRANRIGRLMRKSSYDAVTIELGYSFNVRADIIGHWEAPNGGYPLTACFATGRAAGLGVPAVFNRETDSMAIVQLSTH